ncbi:hypothetical protein K0M31_003620 [Melipona bicolor]|uniref:Uncharacterized protein n=1 Tax=Melipona bicolor TaxID=60889 RepID=A0AA40FZY9_9HYME|nr:hypothetical protein K0M31_003620 [Melipona bicolor]
MGNPLEHQRDAATAVTSEEPWVLKKLALDRASWPRKHDLPSIFYRPAMNPPDDHTQLTKSILGWWLCTVIKGWMID